VRPETAGRLYVVATPIGNLGDVTARAVEVLAGTPLVAAEDTRRFRRLAGRAGIEARAVSFHARNAARRMPGLLAHLRAGQDLALVTDAGTPGVSDPGAELVGAWRAEGGVVVPVPGPSSVTAAISATGIAGPRWVFEGFLPRRGRERRERVAALAADRRGAVLFESPDRVAATIDDLASACGPERPAAVCRELTKLHEQIVVANLGLLGGLLADGAIPTRGEFVIVLGMGEPVIAPPDDDADAETAARLEVDRLTERGLARTEAARRVARERGLSRRRLYRG
jgi:16S rRNA (cytidine1402-2'-O)-methyltransferase